jgi:hypothetical protein
VGLERERDSLLRPNGEDRHGAILPGFPASRQWKARGRRKGVAP